MLHTVDYFTVHDYGLAEKTPQRPRSLFFRYIM